MCKNDCCNCCCYCDDEPRVIISKRSKARMCYNKDQDDTQCMKPKIIKGLKEKGGEFPIHVSIERNMNCTYDDHQRWHIYINAIYRKQIKCIERLTGMKHVDSQTVGDKMQVTFDESWDI